MSQIYFSIISHSFHVCKKNITISQIIMIIFGEIADWNLWVIKFTSSLIFSISISGSQIVFVDILQVQMSHRITDIYLAHQCDVIWYIHQWLGRTICQTARWELTQHVAFSRYLLDIVGLRSFEVIHCRNNHRTNGSVWNYSTNGPYGGVHRNKDLGGHPRRPPSKIN